MSGPESSRFQFNGIRVYACIGLVLALVATTTVMAVQDRVREHAILQTLGFTGGRIFGIVLLESLLLSVAGGLFGTAAALVALTWSHLAIGTEGVTVAIAPSAALAGLGFGLAAIVGILAGLVPAWQAARADIVASLRSV
jgi:putative ABC transport system permease protein